MLTWDNSLGDPDKARSLDDSELITAWSVPSIKITRRLGSVEVDEDSKYLMITDTAISVSIYYRQGIPASKTYLVNSELSKYFSRRFDVKPDDRNLLELFLNCPIEDLGGILANNNRFLDEIDDVQSEPETHHEENSVQGLRSSNPPSSVMGHASHEDLVPAFHNMNLSTTWSADQLQAADIRVARPISGVWNSNVRIGTTATPLPEAPIVPATPRLPHAGLGPETPPPSASASQTASRSSVSITPSHHGSYDYLPSTPPRQSFGVPGPGARSPLPTAVDNAHGPVPDATTRQIGFIGEHFVWYPQTNW